MLRRTIIPLLACAALIGCNDKQSSLPPPKPPEVLISQPVAKEITDYEQFTGRTQAVEDVTIRARVTGYLEKANFKEGDDVKKGQVLFEIDPRIYKAEVDKAKANVTQAEAHLKRLDADAARAETLVGKGTISREEYDKTIGDRAEAAAGVGVAKASLASADLNLKFCEVKSPLDGRVSRRFVDPGNLVKADDTALTTIVSLDPIHAYFDVDERTLLGVRRLIRAGKIKSAREATINIDLGLSDEEGFPHAGTINFVDNKVDATTGTLRIRGVFPNPNSVLTPGLFVRVRVPISAQHNATLISERALGTDQGRKFLYVVNEKDEVVYRPVKIGALHDGLREIEDGLSPGERVIVSGLQRVRPGVKVEAKLVDNPVQTVASKSAFIGKPGSESKKASP